MKVRVTNRGLYGAKGAIPVGTEIEIDGDIPAGWKGRVEAIKEDPKPKAKAVTNPAKVPPAKKPGAGD